MTADALCFKIDHLFIVDAFFFHFASCLFAKIAFSAVQITKGKLKFSKIENMQLWHFVSSVTKKRNPLNLNNFSCTVVSSQTFQRHALKISVSSGHWKWIVLLVFVTEQNDA